MSIKIPLTRKIHIYSILNRFDIFPFKIPGVNVDFGSYGCYTTDLGSGLETGFCGLNHPATFVFHS